MRRVLTEDQKQRARERAKDWHWANKERANATSRKWAAVNAERARERAKKWRLANPELARVATQRKRAKKPELYAAHRRNDFHNRRARLGGLRLSKNIALRLLEIQQRQCNVCRGDLSAGYELDHIMPLALGGRNEDENIQLLCPPCNRSKGAKHPEEFLRSKGLR